MFTYEKHTWNPETRGSKKKGARFTENRARFTPFHVSFHAMNGHKPKRKKTLPPYHRHPTPRQERVSERASLGRQHRAREGCNL